MKPFISVNNVSYQLQNKEILKDVNFKANCYEWISIIGDNGSGKTTFCKIMMGILKPTKGEIYIDGEPLTEMALFEIGQKIGYLFQNVGHQIFAPSVEEELAFAMRFKEIDEIVISKKIEEMINRFKLQNARHIAPYFLSQGEKQRLAIATILLNNPKFLILDEPTTGLDYERKNELGKLLCQIKNEGIGIIMVSHDIEFVKQYSNRIFQIKDGRVIGEE